MLPAEKRASDGTVVLTVAEVAKFLRVCTATVYALVRRGELPSMRANNAIRIVVTKGEEG